MLDWNFDDDSCFKNVTGLLKIVSGQHRNHYGEVAGMLVIVGEIKESMGVNREGREILYLLLSYDGI